MKRKCIVSLLIFTLCVQVILAASCDGGVKSMKGDSFTVPEVSYSTYDNLDFSDYSDTGEAVESNIADQWSKYGVGDPYIFRFNGVYYMYCSTKDRNDGVRAWKSTDLINWEKCNPEGLKDEGGNEILPAGYVSMDPVIVGAYAPEVYYFNGIFYMYSSPAGSGHYVFASDSPEGPFVRVTDNFGMNIDGSVFIDDDESIYFLTADTQGITIRTMESMTDINVSSPDYKSATLSSANIGGWTEGPMMIKREGIYYLTYTGTNVLSEGYRVSYSTETDGNSIVERDSFTAGVDLPVLLQVSEEENFKGLGHSSTVLGPDLDSYYLAYHTYKGPGPYRSMAIDRLVFNGTQMSVDGSARGSIAANLPAFTVADGSSLTASDGKLLSSSSTGNVFSAEFNFVGDCAECIVAYQDAGNYAYVRVDYNNHKIRLLKRASGQTSVVAEGTLVNDFDEDVLHTVRVAYADGKADVHFDNMCKISNASISLTGGKIGYANVGADSVYATTFSNVAKGYSDRIELKQSGASIGASNYLPENYFSDVNSYSLGSGSGLSVVDIDDEYETDEGYNGAYQLKLANKGDFARYLTYFKKDGHYGLRLTYDQKYAGTQIGIQYNSGDVRVVTLPEVATSETGCMISTFVDEYDMKKGVNFITIYGAGDETAFVSYTFEEKSAGEFVFENSLEDVMMKGATYSTMFRLVDGGHATRGGSIMLCYVGDDTLSNFEVEVDMTFSSVSSYRAGLLIRGRNFATAQGDGISSIQGYYVALNNRLVSLSKFNYGYSQTNIEAESIGISTSEMTKHTFKLKVVADGNTLTIYLDGQEIISYTDAHAFLTGHIGIYSEGAEVVYKNLKIKGI